MENTTETALARAAVMTFEEMGFLLPTGELSLEQQNAQVDAAVSIQFKGPLAGSFVVRVCGGLAPVIAANMLGEDDAPPAELQLDALREIANVICGNALPLIAGKQEVFQLEAPAVIYPAGPDSAPDLSTALSAAAAKVQIGLDQGRADVFLLLE